MSSIPEQLRATCKEFPEKSFLKQIVKRSGNFKRFHESERNKIKFPITWLKDEAIPRGISGRNSYNGKKGFMRLRNIPCKPEEDTLIAHELQHLLIYQEGFTATIPKEKKYENFSGVLTSMLHDPIVNEKLKRFEFDLKKNYEDEDENSIDQLKENPTPKSELSKYQWIFQYVGRVLEWKVVYGSLNLNENKFFSLFHKKYPEITQRGKELLEIIEEKGFNTPEKMRELLKFIITKFGLNGYLGLI